MPLIPCAIGDSIRLGRDICLHLTSRWEDQWHLFIEARWGQELHENTGFHASAPCDFGWNAHVLVLRDGDVAGIGPVRLWIEDAQRIADPARALRDAVLHFDAPSDIGIARVPGMGGSRLRRSRRTSAC